MNQYTINEYGAFTGVLKVTRGHLIWRHEFDLTVTDENGQIPSGSFEVYGGESGEVHYYVNDLPAYASNGTYSRDDTLEQFNIEYDDYQTYYPQLQEYPVWSMEKLSGTLDIGLYQHSYETGSYANLRMDTRPAAGEEAVILLRCDWGEMSWSKEVTIMALESPMGFPSGLVFPFEGGIWNVRAGVSVERLNYSNVSFADGWMIEGELPRSSYHYGTDDYSYNANGRIVFNTPGTYNGYFELHCANIVCRQPFTLRVADENGEVPQPSLHLSGASQGVVYYYVNDFTDAYYDAGDGLYSSDTSFLYLYIQEYNQYVQSIDGTPAWELEILEGNMVLGVTLNDYNPRGCHVSVLSKPSAGDSARVALTCTWGDMTGRCEFTVEALESPSGFPQGVEFDFGDRWTVKAGEGVPSIDHYAHYTDNWSIQGEQISYSYSFGSAEWEWNGDNLVFYTPGFYPGRVNVYCANICYRKSFTLAVSDADGNYPAFEPSIDDSYLAEDLTLFIFDVPQEGSLIKRTDDIYNIGFDGYTDTASEIAVRGGEAVWGLTASSGEGYLELVTSSYDGIDYEVMIHVDHMPDAPMDEVVTLTCDVLGWHWEYTMTVHFIALESLPTGISPHEETITFTQGQVIDVTGKYSPDNWTYQGSEELYTGLTIPYGNGATEYVTASDGSRSRIAKTPGTYDDCTLYAICCNMSLRQPITVIIEPSGEPEGDLELDPASTVEMDYYLGAELPLGGMDDYGMARTLPDITTFRITNYDALVTAGMTGEPEWGVRVYQGSAKFVVFAEGKSATLLLTRLPDGPETCTVGVTVRWGSKTATGFCFITFQNAQMPTGMERDFDALNVKVGDLLDIRDKVRFANGWSLPGYETRVLIDGFDGDITVGDVWRATEPGVWQAEVVLWTANIQWREPVTITVTGVDGTIPESAYVSPEGTVFTLPAQLKAIEAEAFAGVAANKIVIPEGCVSIGNRAFAGCENLVEIVIPASVAEIADGAFDGVSGIYCIVNTDYAKDYCLDHGLIPVVRD